MAELQLNIARLQQCLDVTVGTPSIGDVVKVTSTSPLAFDLGPNGGGTGTVDTIVPTDPITVDSTDPANPIIDIEIANQAQAGVVVNGQQEWWGRKIFNDVPKSANAPFSSDDITNKAYVDTFAAGLQVKAAVRAATLVDGNINTAFQNGSSIDAGPAVVLVTGDRILIKDQADPIENGIYTVNASGAPTRATDYDAAGEANVGTFTTVTEGGQKNTQWVQINTGTPDPGTDPLNFSRLNISGNVNTIQSPTRGTLTGAVTLDSNDIYYSGFTGSTAKDAIDAKQNTITGGASTITTANLTANRALISSPGGKVAVSGTTSTQLGYLTGVTSNIQTQLNNKQPLDGDLTAIAALAGTSGFLRKTALNTWALDTVTYAPLASPAFTGTPTAPNVTPATDSSTNIANTAFVQSAIAASSLSYIKVTLSSADILNCFTSPVTLISAPGAGKTIQILGVSYRLTYNSAPYSATTCHIAIDTAASTLVLFSSTILDETANALGTLTISSNLNNLVENKALVFKGAAANPTGGNSPIDLYITYRIITL